MASLLDFFQHPDTLDAVMTISRFVACFSLGWISGLFFRAAIIVWRRDQ